MLERAKVLLASTLIAGAFAWSAPAMSGGLALISSPADTSDNTFTSAASFCTSGSTGYLSSSANAADTGGNNDGFELNPTNAYADDGGYASSVNSRNDRHRFYDYGASIGSTCAIEGIEVRLDWWVDTVKDSAAMQVELSWDGGTSWTAAKTDSGATASEHTVVLGGATDTWGRTWSVGELSNANFRVRVSTYGCCSSTWTYRDFYLDWVPVDVFYGP